MYKPYRPEGLYEALNASPFAQEYRDSPARIEFVLDAMLERLRVNTISVLSYRWVPDATEWADKKGGTLVFIPDD